MGFSFPCGSKSGNLDANQTIPTKDLSWFIERTSKEQMHAPVCFVGWEITNLTGPMSARCTKKIWYPCFSILGGQGYCDERSQEQGQCKTSALQQNATLTNTIPMANLAPSRTTFTTTLKCSNLETL